MIPPLFLKLHIAESNSRPIKLTLPLFLIYPFLLLAALIALPFILLVLLFLLQFKKIIFVFKSLFFLPSLACALRGFEVDVSSGNSIVFIKIK